MVEIHQVHLEEDVEGTPKSVLPTPETTSEDEGVDAARQRDEPRVVRLAHQLTNV